MEMVPVWWDEDGYLLCRACATDARAGGAKLTKGSVPARRYECDFCHEIVRAA
jgi:hypothetical protein